MRAIEITSKTDSSGHLKIDCMLNQSDSAVRVLILVDDEGPDHEEEQLWIRAVARNPVFDFLKEPEEDIYGALDGEPLND